MPKIINPLYGEDPVASALTRVGQAMFGNTGASALRDEQMLKLQRENVERQNLADVYRRMGQGAVDPTEIAFRATLAGDTDYAKMGRFLAAGMYGAEDPRTTAAMVGAGDSYGSTYGGFSKTLDETRRANDMASSDRRYSTDQTVAENARQFDQKPTPAIVNGAPVFVPQSGAVAPGVAPVLTNTEVQGTRANAAFGNMGALPPSEQAYLGADPTTRTQAPKNYRAPDGKVYITYDGRTDVNGAPLPPGGYMATVQGGANEAGFTNAVTTDLQSKKVSYLMFNKLLDQADALTSDPTRFGVTGAARSIAQEVGQIGQNAAYLLGTDNIAAAQAKVAAEAQSLGINPTLLFGGYDTGLPEVDTVWGLLTYSGASALAGQENRSVSDKDVVAMRDILGDPKSVLSSAEGLKAKLAIARKIVQDRQTMVDGLLGGGAGGPPPAPAGVGAPASAPGATPTPPPAAAPPAAPAVEQWTRGPDGKLQRVRPQVPTGM